MGPALNILRRLSGSTFVLILVMVVAFDLFITAAKPLRFFNATGFTPLDQNPLVSKLPEFLSSRTNPDVLMLGSSLMLVPAVRCDDALEGRKTRYDSWYRRNYINEYTKASYLQSLLRKATGQPLTVTNLGVIASVMSDHCLILEKALAAGKKPRVVVVGIAPRDFLDNYRSQLEKTPVYQVLADFNCLGDLLERNATPDEMRDFAVGTLWHFYKVKADYRTFATAWFANLTGHPINLFSSTTAAGTLAAAPPPLNPDDADAQVDVEANAQVGLLDGNVIADYSAKPNTLNDLEIYQHVYNPPNIKMFEQQERYLRRVLKAARKADVTVVLVNMPLTQENKRILSADVYCRYREAVASICRDYSTQLIDLDSPGAYSLADFEDSCHMNAGGGRKFYAELVESLSSNRRTLACLRGQAITVGERQTAPAH